MSKCFRRQQNSFRTSFGTFRRNRNDTLNSRPTKPKVIENIFKRKSNFSIFYNDQQLYDMGNFQFFITVKLYIILIRFPLQKVLFLVLWRLHILESKLFILEINYVKCCLLKNTNTVRASKPSKHLFHRIFFYTSISF